MNSLKLAEKDNLTIIEADIPVKEVKGLYKNGVIVIDKKLNTRAEKESILAEELGHHYTTEGNILDQTCIHAQKQEETARRWAYDFKVPLSSFIEAYEKRIDHFDLIEKLEVTEQFFIEAVAYYKSKHGNCVEADNYIINFDPLGVMKKF